jgi:GntR family transcriptional regulator
VQFVIVPGSDLPIYRQIMRQVTDALSGGRLRPGDKLTSQRELAEQLVVSPLTVKKAYDELEREGLIATERGRGTFVTSGAATATPREQRERLRPMVRQLLSRARLSGLTLEDVAKLLQEEDLSWNQERNRQP